MSLFGAALQAAARVRFHQLRAHARDPRPSQEAALRKLLARAARTHFGREHGFERIRDVGDFRAHVPLRNYADLQPWLARALTGEPDVVWPGRIRYFGMSSGTTAGNKYLPLSPDSIHAQQRFGFDPLASYLCFSGDRELLDGKALLLGASTQLERASRGVWIGDNTGIMARHMPLIVQRNQLPSRKVRAIEDWDRKIAAVAKESLTQDVRILAGTPSWFRGMFDQLLREAHARGRRAEHVHHIWPNLRLLTGGGVSYEPYRRLIRSRLGRHVPYVDVYNATEGGIMGVQDRPDEPEMLLLPDNGLFYEFIPVEELGSGRPRRHALWEVETGVVYALALSTMSGLFGYLIGDCLRFVERFPHRFVFEGRSAAFLNVTGEHVSQGELERAVRVACHGLGCGLREFTVTADIGVGTSSGARHVFLIEFEGDPPDLERCAELIDSDLGQANTDYTVHRASRVGLLRPEVRALRPGAFHAFMRERGKLGGQHKVPRVVLDRNARATLEAFSAIPAHGRGNGTGSHEWHAQ